MKHIILDTNIFARYLIADVDHQHKKAKEKFDAIEKEEIVGEVSILVIDELIWVLENNYGYTRKEYIPKFLNLFSLKNIKIIEVQKEIVLDIFGLMQNSKIDFTDYYLSKIADGRKIFSFDKDFQKLLKN